MKILVAIDSSRARLAVILSVAARPWPPQTTFEILSVADSPEEDEAWTQHVTAIAEDGARRLCAVNLNASAFVMHGHPNAAIVDRAKEIGADLIVIGAEHHGASAVIRHAHCSVEVVRAGRDWSQGMKIVLATDGSDESLAAARAIASRPWPGESEVRMLSVVELSLTFLQSTLEAPYLNEGLVERQRAEAMKRAENAIRSAEEVLAPTGLKTSESISVLVGNPKQMILDEARQWPADLIVVGSHGRSGLDRFLLGSVSEAVATHAECSVEVVRSRIAGAH